MITLADINMAYRKASKPERKEFIKLILPDLLEIQIFASDKFRVAVETVLLTSELRPIKRISKLESVTGLDDYYPYEKHDPTLPERIQDLETKFETCEFRPIKKPILEIKTETKTGIRAMHLISKLKASGKSHLTHKEIKSILTGDLPEDYRINEKCKNPRKTIIDVLNEAATICSDVFLDQKKIGHKEWRIGLKS